MSNEEGRIYQENRPLYWFDSELTHRDLTIWDNMRQYDYESFVIHPFTNKKFMNPRVSLSPVVNHLAFIYSKCHAEPFEDMSPKDGAQCCADFQTILRLIPGSYKNGPWKQLDGFFGPYMNQETLEINSFIPELN